MGLVRSKPRMTSSRPVRGTWLASGGNCGGGGEVLSSETGGGWKGPGSKGMFWGESGMKVAGREKMEIGDERVAAAAAVAADGSWRAWSADPCDKS